MTPFRIIYDEYGQTGNRFLSYVDSVGWAMVNKKKVIILFPEKALIHYDKFRHDKHICIPLWNKPEWMWRLFRKVFLHNHLFQRFLQTNISKQFGFYAGWSLSSSMDFYPQIKEQVFNLFEPNGYVTERVIQEFSLHKDKGKVIVGVHIRRGDFKFYSGGLYYYEDEVYIHYMKQISRLLPNCVFFLSCEENISTAFNMFPLVEKSTNSAPYDMYALSKCDYIIGPPSTFSGWASMVGNVPICIISKKNADITLSDFNPVRG